ncbi:MULTISPECIES: hypothetical protein [Leuconostoc]|uniref:hypothetical protein n=1 Tax=Leuconostoc TaxID=1243 RepID=UPI001F6156A8|nr:MULTISPECIES: hypothetical protein [Leuconostoc]
MAGVVAFSVDLSKASADSTSTIVTAPFPVTQSLIQMSEGGSATYGRWEYKYTAQPYALFYNSARDQWKMVQVTSYTQHTVNVMIDGYQKTYDRWLRGQYAP